MQKAGWRRPMVAGGVSLTLTRSLRLGLRISGIWRRQDRSKGKCRFRSNQSAAQHLRSQDATSTFKVQLVDEASEALGIWSAADDDLNLNPEGSFGPTRSGSVSAP